MSNPVLTAAEAAGAPALIAVLKAVQAFVVNIGTDPTKWALTVPGALTVLVGTASLEVPVLAAAEAGAVQATVNAKIGDWITKLQAATAAPAA